MAVSHGFTRFELVHRAAIRATGFAGVCDVQRHPRVAVPYLHRRQWAGANDAAMGVEVLGAELNGRWVGHRASLVQFVGCAAAKGVTPSSANERIWGCGR